MKSYVASWLSATFLIACGSVLDAIPVRPTSATPGHLSPDCTTVIVTNERRPNAAPSCKDRRQARKLPAAVSQLFREEVDNYPESEIANILKQTPSDVKDLFNVLNTQLDPHTNLTERVAFHMSNDEDYSGEREENVCSTTTRNIYPREANLRNSLVYIPNNHDFMQVIQAEICQHPNEDCRYLADSLPYGMTSACVQKYSYKKLLYMDPLDKRLSSDLFRYPSCCVCNVKFSALDLRSNPVNSSRTVTRPGSSSTTPLPSLTSSSGTVHSLENVAHQPSNSLAISDQQPTDRSHDLNTPAVSPNRRTSKQTRQPTNQTLILSDDKVYAPSK